MLEIGVVLAGEGFAESRRNEDARGQVGVLVKGESIAEEKGCGRDVIEEGEVSD